MNNSNLQLYHDYKQVKEDLWKSLKTTANLLKYYHDYIYNVNENNIDNITQEAVNVCYYYYVQAIAIYDQFKHNKSLGLYNHVDSYISESLFCDIEVIYNDVLRQYRFLHDRVN